jgi:LCP family protein required for cell wall assembly
MANPEQPELSGSPRSNMRHRLRLDTPRRRRRILWSVGAGVMVIVAAVSGFVVYQYNSLSSSIHRSTVLMPTAKATTGVPQNTGATNILIMGLDSRLDENGKALPAEIYNALHAGNGSDGGYNTNVLMLIHIPGNGAPAVGISIPRDDYAELPGSPDGESKSKIKEAYGLELDQTFNHLVNTTKLSRSDIYQQARTAARQEEITTVSQFLGGVAIDHFVEVTMAAFYQVAEAVQPVTVCLNETTSDPYSGANFQAGDQQLTAAQAVSFVRQRRDTKNVALDFTDLDRARRQQAFIISLAYKLKQQRTFTNFETLGSLITVAKQNIAIDSGLNLLSFAHDAQSFAGGNISFVTLPIAGFATVGGKDVNLVDLVQVRAEVARLLAPRSAKPTPVATSHSIANPTSVSTPAPTNPAVVRTATAAPDVSKEWAAPLSSGSIPCVK